MIEDVGPSGIVSNGLGDYSRAQICMVREMRLNWKKRWCRGLGGGQRAENGKSGTGLTRGGPTSSSHVQI
jgi:hypothetical protein